MEQYIFASKGAYDSSFSIDVPRGTYLWIYFYDYLYIATIPPLFHVEHTSDKQSTEYSYTRIMFHVEQIEYIMTASKYSK